MLAGSSADRSVSASVLQAFAIEVDGRKIEMQVEPLSFLDDPSLFTKRIMLLVDGQEMQWNSADKVRYFDRFRVATSSDSQNGFHVTLADEGPLVACDYVSDSDSEQAVTGYMTCRITCNLQRLVRQSLVIVHLDFIFGTGE